MSIVVLDIKKNLIISIVVNLIFGRLLQKMNVKYFNVLTYLFTIQMIPM